jgi:hypothetical protein
MARHPEAGEPKCKGKQNHPTGKTPPPPALGSTKAAPLAAACHGSQAPRIRSQRRRAEDHVRNFQKAV